MVNTPQFKRFFQHGIFNALFASILKMASFFKISFIIGSYTAFFSMTSIIMPLSGVVSGRVGILIISAMICAVKSFFSGVITFKYLAYHIPGVFAAFYWTTRSAWMRVVVPLICMGAFIAHPIGSGAWIYTLYWLIPVSLYFSAKNNLWFEALGSTFIAHAVGSVIYLYADPLSSAAWLGLIPIVAVERFVFATGMVVMHKIAAKALQSVKEQFKTYMPALFFRHNNIQQ